MPTPDSPYIFSFISETSDSGKIALDYSNEPMTIWKKVLVMDSVFNFYPSLEIILPDDFGFISDVMVAMEGMTFTAKIGDKTNNEFIEHKYAVQKNELIHVKNTTHLSGDVLLNLTSYHNLQDVRNSMAWNDTISNIVKELCGQKGLKLENSKIKDDYVEATDGKDVWYQINETAESCIKKLAKRAFSQTYEKSPYLTFINANGELYFSSIDKMFKNPPINKDNPYTFSGQEDQSYSPWAIKNVYTIQGGLEINYPNYNKKTFTRDKSGVVNTGTSGDGEVSKINDHITKGSGSTFFRQDLITDTIPTDFDDFGIYEDKDRQFYKAFVNSLFIDSTLYLRLEITVNFNYQAVSGKVITLKVPSNIKEKSGGAKEYDGEWLILNSRHFYDKDLTPFTRLVIAKSRFIIDSTNPFKNRLLS